MSLIKCTECGKEFSDKAEVCPNCGCPTAEILKSKNTELNADNDEQKENNDMDKDVTPENTASDPEVKGSFSEKKEAKTKNKAVGVIIGVIVAVAMIATVIVFATKNSRDYSKAQKLLSEKDYATAESIFKELGDYEDSSAMVSECEYQIGLEAFEREKYEDALQHFESIEAYKNSSEMVEKCQYELSTDGQFMRSLSKGLMARWDKSDEYEKQGLVGEDPARYREFCQIELDLLEKFYDMTFDNPDLQTDARQYIDYLKEAQSATNQYTVNYAAYSQRWGTIYADRTILLQKMVSEYGLSVDEKHQKTLDSMMNDATAANENKKVKADVAEMCKSFEVIVKEDEWGYKTYSLKMKNTTDLTFDYFYVDANFVDDQGNIVTTGSGGNLESWKPGVEANAQFWVDDQKIDINSYKVTFTPHYASGSYYE